jgi:protein O-mannosyl-transferase
MSQKKLKELRRIENQKLVKKTTFEPLKGIRQIIKENWKFLLILCIGIFVLYANALHGDFVSDDYASITQNPDVLNMGKILQTKLVATIYKTIIAMAFGIESPVAFHVFSVLMYCLVCIFAFIFLSLIFNKTVTKLTLILFAVLPIHVEVISWISGEPYLLVSLFILMFLIFFVLFLNSKNKKYLIFMAISLLLLYFTDRFRGFSVFLLGFLFVLCFKDKSKIKINLWKISLVLVGIVAFIFIFSWPMISGRIGAVNSGYNGSDSIFYNPFFQYPTSITKYLQLMLIPTDLTLYHTMYILPVWLNWLVTLSYLSAVIYFFFKDKKIFFALAFIFLAAVGSMTPVKVSWLVAERYLFLGSLGFCLFLVLFFQRFGKKLQLPFFVLFILVTGFYAARVYSRNIDWQTNHKLWISTCQYSPNSHNAWNNIGDDYDKLAQLETTEEGRLAQYLNSIKGFSRSTIVKTNYADAFHNRANIFYKIGRYDLARDSYETALSFGPNLYQSYFSLLQIDLIEKNYDSAMSHLNRLHQVKKNDLQVYYITAVVYANFNQKDQAISILEQILKVTPEFVEAQNLLKQLKAK